MAKIHYTKHAASSYSATTSQAGYGPDNLGIEQLGRPYRSTGLGATDLVINFASVKNVQTLFLHDVNFPNATIEKSADGVTFVGIGVLTFYAGREGRYRGAITVADANVKALKVKIAAGAALDGLPNWRAGAAYPFASSIAIPAPFQFNYVPRWVKPQVRQKIVNGQEPRALTGTGFHLLQLPFKPYDNEDLRQAMGLAESATVLLELGLANYPWQLWPAQLDNEEVSEAFGEPRTSDVTLNFREVV